MTKSIAIIGSLVLASVVGAAIFLRPHAAARDELAQPASIPPAMLSVVKTKMGRHEYQMKALVAGVILLDDDGVARAAGEIFDEPSLARPVAGDELNGLLPERFFTLQDDLRRQARQLVIASEHHDRAAVADQFAALSKTCITCHEVYLRGTDFAASRGGLANTKNNESKSFSEGAHETSAGPGAPAPKGTTGNVGNVGGGVGNMEMMPEAPAP